VLVDTHIHLDNKAYYDDLENVLKNAKENNVKNFIIPGADINDLSRAIEISKYNKNIFFAVGIHPYHIDQYKEFIEKDLESNINNEKCIAIGECGLDYFRLPEDENKKIKNIKEQKEVFISQIELAIKYDKPLIVHIRDASYDALSILKEYKNKNLKGVLHCFNADEQLLELSDNFYFGIGGVLTFKNAKKLPEVLKKIPIERIVLETDGPYLTPHPHRGKRNEPSFIPIILDKVSEILNIDVTKLQSIIKNNTKTLFKEDFI
jgi:TatD DNase family protein